MALRRRFRRRRIYRSDVFTARLRRSRRRGTFRRSVRRRARPTSGLRRTRRVRARVGPEWKTRVNDTISGYSVTNASQLNSVDPSIVARPVTIYATRTPQLVQGPQLGQMIGRRLSSCRWQLRFQISAGIYQSSVQNAEVWVPTDITYSVRMILYQVKNANGQFSPNTVQYHDYAVPTGRLEDADATRIMNALFRIDDDLLIVPDSGVYSVGAPGLYRFRSGTRDDIQILYDKTKMFYSGGRNAWLSRMKFKINPLQFETRVESDGDLVETYFDNHVYAIWILQPVRHVSDLRSILVTVASDYWSTQSVIQDTLLYKDD